MLQKKFLVYFVLVLFSSNSYCQQVIEGITKESYTNAKNTYNYTYWDASWKTGNIATRKFSNQTSSYNLNIDYSNLRIASLKINSNPKSATAAFAESKSVTFNSMHPGNIDYRVLQNGNTLLKKRSTNPTTEGSNYSQMADYGTWCNRRLIDNLNFDGSTTVNPNQTGIEFTNWHNRFRISFLFTPTQNIENGQLQLSVEMPDEYSKVLYFGQVFGFATSDTLEGFSVKGGITADSVFMCGNTLTARTASQTYKANVSYQISLIFYTVKEDFCKTYASIPDDANDLIISTTPALPNPFDIAKVSYANDEGVYYIDIPSYQMGYNSKSTIDLMQNIHLQIKNSEAVQKRVRLCFREKFPKNVVGFSSMLRNPDGDPTGIPLQISKNWHTEDKYYKGPWVREYTELIIPANSILKFDYTRVGARWGKVFGAFSHQLSVVGYGVHGGGWLEAGLGSFGESITHSPDYELGQSNICDYRPFLVTNQYYGGTSQEYSWTGNLGGMDLFRYENGTQRIYQSQVKTRFKKYGPNLSETSISTYSADNKLKMDYTFQLHRSDDFLRVYYKVKVKALEDAAFTRFDIFQMGSDNYLCFIANKVAYGNSEGVISEFQPSTGTVGYTMDATPMPGKDPWLWAGDGMSLNANGTNYNGIEIDANNSFIIRSYDASFGGIENDTPHFRERTTFHSPTNKYPQSYCIVPPAGVTSFAQGDSVEFVIELCLMPKVAQVYFGPNANFKNALAKYGDSWEMLYREVVGNSIVASSATNTVNQGYPLTVETVNNAATVNIKSGIGYIPIVFTGLTNIKDPKLWRIDDSGSTLIDQSNYGKDFWQTEYDTETGLYELIYNLNHDTEGDSVPDYTYSLEVSSTDSIISIESPPRVLPDECIPSEPIPTNCIVTGLSISRVSASLVVGDTLSLTAEVSPENATNKNVIWNSSNSNVATVSTDGFVTAISLGSASIQAQSEEGAYTAVCAITVKEPSVSGVDILEDSIFLIPGNSEQLNVRIFPSNAYNQRVVWKSSDTAIVKVDENGLVTAQKIGKARVTVKTEDGGYLDLSHVIVTKSTDAHYAEILSSEICIFPNPANDKLTVLSYKDNIESIRIFNSVGTEISDKIHISGGGERRLLDLSAIPNGLYILVVNSSYQKLIVFK